MKSTHSRKQLESGRSILPRYDYGYQSVHFNLKQQKEKMVPTQILLSVRIGGRRVRVYTGKKVEPAFWDTRKGFCRKDSFLSPRVGNRLKKLNSFLEKILDSLDYADMNAAEHDRLLTIEDLRAIVRDPSQMETKEKETVERPAPLEILQNLAMDFDTVLSSRGLKGAAASRRTYLYCCKLLSAFIEETRFDLSDFSKLDRSFYQHFVQWLNGRNISSSGEEKHYSASTVQTSINAISNLHHKAYLAGLADVPEHRGRDFIVAYGTQNTKIYLTEDELRKLQRLHPASAKEQAVLDMFVLASYTGLRVSDVNQLNSAVISDGVIRLYQKKTHGYVSIPLLKEISGLANAYSCSAEGFPNIRACFANKILKALCRQAGINKRVLVRECRGGTVLVKNYFKYELVSFHTARRSCITNLFRRGYSPNYLMTMSGHKSLSSFQRYLKSTAEELSIDFIKELKKHKAI